MPLQKRKKKKKPASDKSVKQVVTQVVKVNIGDTKAKKRRKRKSSGGVAPSAAPPPMLAQVPQQFIYFILCFVFIQLLGDTIFATIIKTWPTAYSSYWINYFKDYQQCPIKIEKSLKIDPSKYESYVEDDVNYAGATNMVLILIKELQKKYTLKETLNKIFKDLWKTPPNDKDWKTIFYNVFNITVSDFYNIVKKSDFSDITKLQPNMTSRLSEIFT